MSSIMGLLSVSFLLTHRDQAGLTSSLIKSVHRSMAFLRVPILSNSL